MEKINTYIQFTKEAITLHEISSIMLPGLFFLYCFNLIDPQIGNFTAKDLSIGALIVLLLLSYVVGHFVQGVGNLIETYIIERLWGDLRTQKMKHKVTPTMSKIYNNHKKLCRGIAAGLLLLLLLAVLFGTINLNSISGFIYSLLIALASISLFIYMRRFEGRQFGLR